MARTAEFQGCTFSYDVVGVGEPVVFIQGVGLQGAGWRFQTDELRSRFSCLTFDNRGMALSQPAAMPITVAQMAADTLAIMDEAEIPSAHVVGHSLGGCIALQIALANPERVKSLSLLCTSARGADATRLTWKMARLGARTRVGTRRMRRLAFLQIVMSPQYLATHAPDTTANDLAPVFGHDLGETPPIVTAQLGALTRFDATERLKDLSVPTLVLSAAHDVIFPPRYGRQLADTVPRTRFLEIPNASHGVIIEHAAEVNRALAGHIAAMSRERPA